MLPARFESRTLKFQLTELLSQAASPRPRVWCDVIVGVMAFG
jgi:hypothetical protein